MTSSKFLGVIIDDKANLKDHVSFECRNVARDLGIIIKARKVLQNESLKILHYSFIYIYLIYRNQVRWSVYKRNIEPLFTLQGPEELWLVFITCRLPWLRHKMETFDDKGQCRRALMFSLICAWMNGWVNSREDGDLRRHLTHYDTTVMQSHCFMIWSFWILNTFLNI